MNVKRTLKEMASSPYKLIPGVDVLKKYCGKKNTISTSRLATMSKTLELSKTSEYIIECLYELTYLTGHLIHLCFQHPNIDLSMKKFHNGMKNPYRPELDYLVKIGAINQFYLQNTDGSPFGYYIYSLTPGARQWASIRFHSFMLFQKRQFDNRMEPPSELSYPLLLEILSFNQFHISMIIHHVNTFKLISIDETGNQTLSEINRFSMYALSEGNTILFCSCRHEDLITGAISNHIVQFIDFLMTKQDLSCQLESIVIAVEAASVALTIYDSLRAASWPFLNLLTFINDTATKDASDPLKSIIKVLRHETCDYVIGTFQLFLEKQA